MDKTLEPTGLVLPAPSFLQLPPLAEELGGAETKLESWTGEEERVSLPCLSLCI